MKRGEFFDFCLSPLYYRDQVRASVLRYKFRGARSYAAVYARMTAEAVKSEPEARCDIATWAPVSKKRLRARGYDQARLIAEGAAEMLDLPCVRTLEKTRHTPPQSDITGDEKRRANVSGAYEKCGADVRGLRVLLMDDVVTSGATLSECSRVLLMAGAEAVVCATLARAE